MELVFHLLLFLSKVFHLFQYFQLGMISQRNVFSSEMAWNIVVE